MKHRGRFIFSLLAATLAVSGILRADDTRKNSAVVLWRDAQTTADRNDQDAFVSALRSIGVSVSTSSDFSTSAGVLIVPNAAARTLTVDEISKLKKRVAKGEALVIDGESVLSASFGLKFSTPTAVRSLKSSLQPRLLTTWWDQQRSPAILQSDLSGVTTFYSVASASAVIVIGGNWQRGKVLCFATLYDDLTPYGYGRFNSFPQMATDFLKLQPTFFSTRAEAYVDPGVFFPRPIANIISSWANSGLRAVHLASWYSNERNPLDYSRFIRLCHEQGIAVYAWFEWPHVSQSFWNDHPECREVTATGREAQVDWRYLINLKNAQCRAQAFDEAEQLLRGNDWDGVDIAEIYVEPVGGIEFTADFTPLNNDVRNDVKARFGFDPQLLFDQKSPLYWRNNPKELQTFYRYRQDLTAEITDAALRRMTNLSSNEHQDWETILTLADVSADEKMAQSIGIDYQQHLALAKTYHATVEVEDVASEWSKPPTRYAELGEKYRTIFGTGSFLIDINVVPLVHIMQSGFATDQQSGSELFSLWNNASVHTPRVIVYSASTISNADWNLIPAASAADATIEPLKKGWRVNTRYPVAMNKTEKAYDVDDQPWPCQNATTLWLPAGEHLITKAARRLHHDASNLLVLPADLTQCTESKDGAVFTVDTPLTTYWRLKPKTTATVDGKTTNTASTTPAILRVPKGHHTVELH